MSNYSDSLLYRRLARQARPYWPHIGGLFLLSLLATPIALLTPLPLKIAVDNIVGHHPLPGFIAWLIPSAVARSHLSVLALAAVIFVVVAFLNQLQQLATTALSTYAGEKMVLSFREQLFRQAQRLSLAYHDMKGTTDSVYRIQYDAPSIQWIGIYGVIPFVSALFTLVGMFVVTVQIDWVLAVVAMTVSPALFLVARSYRRRLRDRWRNVKDLESSAMSVVHEGLSAIRVIKAFGQEDREQKRFIERSGAGMWARIRVTIIAGWFDLAISMITALGTAAVLFIGMLHVEAHIITVGLLLLIMGYLVELYAPLQTVSQSFAMLQSSLASAERAFTLLDQAPDVVEKPHARPLMRALGDISFDDVWFRYGEERPVLSAVSFHVAPGTKVGIAGATGAGKTTLVSLLTRFYDPTQGSIMLDGIDLRDYKLADLRNQFAIVLQDPVLFSTTIAENIAYGRPDARPEEIMEAARMANIHDFISSLPEGYETQVGERGMRMSGGERQRISLARAFLKDAPILILDEPTSSVDLRTEAAIMADMERLMEGKTAFLIAHRLSTLSSCDLRLEIDSGQLRSQKREVTPDSVTVAS